MCGRNTPARRAMRSPRLRRRRCRRRAAGPRRRCSRICWCRSIATTCRSIGRARSMPATVSISTARPCAIGSARRPGCFDPIVDGDPAACLRRREDPRRRHDGPGAVAGARPDQDRTALGLCPRRSTILRNGAASRRLLLQPRSRRRAPGQRTWRVSPASFRPTAMPGSRRSTIRPACRPNAAITEVACWAHCRRKFYDVWEARSRRSPRRRSTASPPSTRSRPRPSSPRRRTPGAPGRDRAAARRILRLGRQNRHQAVGEVGSGRGIPLHDQAAQGAHRASSPMHGSKSTTTSPRTPCAASRSAGIIRTFELCAVHHAQIVNRETSGHAERLMRYGSSCA